MNNNSPFSDLPSMINSERANDRTGAKTGGAFSTPASIDMAPVKTATATLLPGEYLQEGFIMKDGKVVGTEDGTRYKAPIYAGFAKRRALEKIPAAIRENMEKLYAEGADIADILPTVEHYYPNVSKKILYGRIRAQLLRKGILRVNPVMSAAMQARWATARAERLKAEKAEERRRERQTTQATPMSQALLPAEGQSFRSALQNMAISEVNLYLKVLGEGSLDDIKRAGVSLVEVLNGIDKLASVSGQIN